MITVRPERNEDHAAIRAVIAAAFGSVGEAVLVDALRLEGELLLSLVATEGADIVGHIAFSRLWVEGGGAPFAALALAPMAVRPDLQNRGIGSRLVAEGHRRLDDAGESLIVVVGHTAYYPRFGYRRDLAEGFASPYQGEAMMAYAFRAAPTRGRLRYAPAFARLG